jgi:DNA-binding MarR family transcriptional regulator
MQTPQAGRQAPRAGRKGTGQDAPPAPAENLRDFLALLRELQKIDPEFPLQYAVCLAEISMNEGLSLTRLAETAGMPLSTVSRIVGALSKHRQKGAPYGLVRVVISAEERRKKEIYLTSRGRAVVVSLAEILAARGALLRA